MTALQRTVARQWLRTAYRTGARLDEPVSTAVDCLRALYLGDDDWSEIRELAEYIAVEETARHQRRQAQQQGAADAT